MGTHTLTLGLVPEDKVSNSLWPFLVLSLPTSPLIFVSNKKTPDNLAPTVLLQDPLENTNVPVPNHIDGLSGNATAYRGDFAASIRRAKPSECIDDFLGLYSRQACLLKDIKSSSSGPRIRHMAWGSFMLMLTGSIVSSDRLKAGYHTLTGLACPETSTSGDQAWELLIHYLDVLNAGHFICLVILLDIVWTMLCYLVRIWPIRYSETGYPASKSYDVPVRMFWDPRTKISTRCCYLGVHLLSDVGLTVTTSYRGVFVVDITMTGVSRLDIHLDIGTLSFIVAPDPSGPQNAEATTPSKFALQQSLYWKLTCNDVIVLLEGLAISFVNVISRAVLAVTRGDNDETPDSDFMQVPNALMTLVPTCPFEGE